MREIKFNAWHVGQKKMYPAAELGEDQLTLSVDGRGFVNVHSGIRALSQFAGDMMIPLQYTGLKDKNDKEIYEGDLIQCAYCKEEGKSGVVTWDGHFADFRLEWNKACCGNARLTRIDNWATVVGNIYENPKLIN